MEKIGREAGPLPLESRGDSTQEESPFGFAWGDALTTLTANLRFFPLQLCKKNLGGVRRTSNFVATTRLPKPLEDARCAHAAAYAHGDHAISDVAAFHFCE
jgi:hypothetical protein